MKAASMPTAWKSEQYSIAMSLQSPAWYWKVSVGN